ncbi:unnamed protein product [Gongylonema pulchrum]|uniref:Rab-GAP TBC domain-containing protein n=1 Tax=Gongylonema pulchrum TaxID=637853 RepID=A0A183EKW9_9BILA|nr:unnamed protein product [Gongylonema pulchrum]
MRNLNLTTEFRENETNRCFITVKAFSSLKLAECATVQLFPETNGTSWSGAGGSATTAASSSVAAIPGTATASSGGSGSCGTTLDDGVPEPAVSILMKMEQMNTCNELDSRSVASIRTGSSSSGSAPTDSFSPRSNKSRENSVPAEDDEDLDLWAVWGNLIKYWEVESKKRPNYIKELVRRGIPQHFRTIAWQLLSDANVSLVHDIYTDCLRKSSPYEKVKYVCARSVYCPQYPWKAKKIFP